MQVADRHGQGIGGVVRRRRLRQAEQQLDHLLHLVLLGPAVAHDRALDLGGRVLDDGQPASTAASIATPRACPSFSALRTFAAWKRFSIATQSGRHEASSAASSR